MIPILQNKRITADLGPHLSRKFIKLSKHHYTCQTDNESHSHKQLRSKLPTSRSESEFLDLVELEAWFFIWMSSARGQESVSLNSASDTIQGAKSKGRYALLQGLHGLLGTFLPDAERLHPGLLDLLQRADLTNVRVRRVPRPELAGPDRVPGTLGVVSGPWVAPGAGGKDGRVHGFHVRDGDEEDELVLCRGHFSWIAAGYKV